MQYTDLTRLTAVSSVDGRYRTHAEALAPYLSEAALIRYRVRIECEYLRALVKEKQLGIAPLTKKQDALLRKIAEPDLAEVEIIKRIETKGWKHIPATNHDVKAVEYYVRDRCAGTVLAPLEPWIHWALTSEDVNNIACALMLRDALAEVILPTLRTVEGELRALARTHAATAMLARTHGQSASPTTFGKEMSVFSARLRRQMETLERGTILAKLNGATGNFNAHHCAYPQVDWVKFSERFILAFNTKGRVRLEPNLITTQIEPHDTYAEHFDALRRTNTLLIDLSQDMWRYISDGWIAQKKIVGEVGSSTMPHKVNPIDFENAEGNLGLSNALLEFFSRKLPISRLQRDLSDSTVERSFGVAYAHAYIAYRALLRGFGKIEVDRRAMGEALKAHPEVLAEAIQTVLKREGVANAYELLKEHTRGESMTVASLSQLIETLPIDERVRDELRSLKPAMYVGVAPLLARSAVRNRGHGKLS